MQGVLARTKGIPMKRVAPVVTIHETPLVAQVLVDDRVIIAIPLTISTLGIIKTGASLEARSVARRLRAALRGYTRAYAR